MALDVRRLDGGDIYGDEPDMFGGGGNQSGGPIDQPAMGAPEIPTDVAGPGGNTERPREVFQPEETTRPIDVQRRGPSPVAATPNPSQSSNPNATTDVGNGNTDQGGGGSYTPARPSTPSPVAAQPPRPFTPMEPLGTNPMSLVTPQSDLGAANVAMRAPGVSMSQAQQYGGGSKQAMFGQAGGLLGGGLGLPGAGDHFKDASQIDSLIKLLTGGGNA